MEPTRELLESQYGLQQKEWSLTRFRLYGCSLRLVYGLLPFPVFTTSEFLKLAGVQRIAFWLSVLAIILGYFGPQIVLFIHNWLRPNRVLRRRMDQPETNTRLLWLSKSRFLVRVIVASVFGLGWFSFYFLRCWAGQIAWWDLPVSGLALYFILGMGWFFSPRALLADSDNLWVYFPYGKIVVPLRDLAIVCPQSGGGENQVVSSHSVISVHYPSATHATEPCHSSLPDFLGFDTDASGNKPE